MRSNRVEPGIVVHEYPILEERTIGDVLVIPPFGMSAHDLFSLIWALRRNHFRVFCLEGRDTEGAGSGVIYDYALSTVTEDIVRSVEFLNFEFDSKPLLVGVSLSARAIAKVGSRVGATGSVLLTPVVDTGYTLKNVISMDLFGAPEPLPESATVLGKVVSTNFVVDAKQKGFSDLKSFEYDVRAIESSYPCSFVAGDEDPWVRFEDVEEMVALGENFRLLKMQSISHELNRNPRVAMKYVEILIHECALHFGFEEKKVIVPSLREMIEQLGKSKRVQRV